MAKNEIKTPELESHNQDITKKANEIDCKQNSCGSTEFNQILFCQS